MNFWIVEKKNQNALHGIFDTKERAEFHLTKVIPEYCQRGLFVDKILTANDFEIIPALDRKNKR